MGNTAKKLLTDALNLPEKERAELAALLIDSLDRRAEEGAAEAWDAEIARRWAEVEAGAVKSVPWPQARRMILGRNDAPDSR